MKIWFDRFLAALRWVGGKLHAFFSVTFDPPPRTRRFYFLCALALFAMGWTSYAFVNSWFYKPTVAYLASMSYVLSGDDGDVALPEMEPVSPVAVTALPQVEVVCHDMSDTPHCTPVEQVKAVEVVSVLPPPVAKPKATIRKSRKVRRAAKHQPFQTYWGF